MHFLIDAHILIWFLEGSASLSAKRRQLIVNGQNNVSVCIASLWEIAIRISRDKLSLAESIPAMIAKLVNLEIEILTISPAHIIQVASLPFHHKDPFDRMIIAQALIEKLPIMSTDNSLGAYGVELL